MSLWGESSALRSLRSFWCLLLVPLGVAGLAAALAAALVEPRWLAAGAPYLAGVGKNVEAAAVAAAFAAGLVASALLSFASGRAAAPARVLLQAAAAAGWIVLLTRTRWSDILTAAPLLLTAALLAFATVAPWPVAAGAGDSPQPAKERSTRGWIVGAGIALLALLELVAATKALSIDVFHHGEVLASALDLLAGGRPFETFIWPHGLHDTGLTTLFLVATGKVGTSPLALAAATVAALGVVAAYAIARALLDGRGEAVAATATLVLAPLVLAPLERAAAILGPLGILLFVALALRTLAAERRGSTWLAGTLLGLGHLFRIEAGLFGAVASGALLAVRHLSDEALTWPRRAHRLGMDALRLTLGFAGILALSRLLFGFPGIAWLRAVLVELPRYHRDAVGLPLPWPIAGWPPDPERAPVAAVAVAWILFGFCLALATLRALAEHRREPTAASRAHAERLAFVAAFALLATRSTLDRFDSAHVLQWAAMPLTAALLLAAARLRGRRSWSARRGTAIAAIALLPLAATGLVAALPVPESPQEAFRSLVARAALLAEHLAPNPPSGPCADRSFTPAELAIPWNRAFVEATCEVENLLREHGVTRLAIADSAPWYWARFGMTAPTRFFAHARAYTPRHQEELIEELRASGAQALLRPRGFLALREFDIPEPVRLPVTEAYLRARAGGAPSVATAIGQLQFWNEAAPCLPAGSLAPASEILLRVNRLLYQPSSRLLFARGRAETAGGEPLAALRIAPDVAVDASVDYGEPRPASGGARGSRAPVGFEALVALRDGERRSDAAVRLQAVLPDGRWSPAELDPGEAVTLGPLAGASWRDLSAAVAAARELGRRDREAAAGTSCDPDRADSSQSRAGAPAAQGVAIDQ